MAKGFFDDSTGISNGEFETCPAGTYTANGIRWLKSCLEDNGNPIYKSDKRGIMIRMEMIRADGSTPNPVYSASPEALMLLVKAFGGDVNKLPPNKTTTEFLLRAYSEIEKSKGSVTCIVNEKGWVNLVKEATVPEGLYKVRFAGARSLDGSETLHYVKVGKGDPSILLQFEIVGNTFGKRTPFDGITLDVFMSDPFDGSHNGLPKFRKNDSSKKPVPVARFEKFMAAFAPSIFDHDWSDYDLANPTQVVVQHALDSREREAVCSYVKSIRGERLYLELLTLTIDEDPDTEATPAVETEPERPAHIYEMGSRFYTDHPKLATFVDWIYSQEQDAFVTVPVSELSQLVLSAKGIKWCPNNLAELWLEVGLEPGAKPIKSLDEETCGLLMAAIENRKESKWA
jgi:hypothetical protein